MVSWLTCWKSMSRVQPHFDFPVLGNSCISSMLLTEEQKHLSLEFLWGLPQWAEAMGRTQPEFSEPALLSEMRNQGWFIVHLKTIKGQEKRNLTSSAPCKAQERSPKVDSGLKKCKYPKLCATDSNARAVSGIKFRWRFREEPVCMCEESFYKTAYLGILPCDPCIVPGIWPRPEWSTWHPSMSSSAGNWLQDASCSHTASTTSLWNLSMRRPSNEVNYPKHIIQAPL